jgi:hypothetical protein
MSQKARLKDSYTKLEYSQVGFLKDTNTILD